MARVSTEQVRLSVGPGRLPELLGLGLVEGPRPPSCGLSPGLRSVPPRNALVQEASREWVEALVCLGLREPEVGLARRADWARGAWLEGTWGTGRGGRKKGREGDGDRETRLDRLGKGREPGQGMVYSHIRVCM